MIRNRSRRREALANLAMTLIAMAAMTAYGVDMAYRTEARLEARAMRGAR